jgi:hypothetical protein
MISYGHGPASLAANAPKAKPVFRSVNSASFDTLNLPNHKDGKSAEISLEPNSRNFRGRSGKTFRERFSTRDVTRALSETLAPIPAKIIADATGSTVRAAENARQGLNAMSLAHFLNACREIPELRAMAMNLMGCETTIDPDFERGFALLQSSFARRLQSGAE